MQEQKEEPAVPVTSQAIPREEPSAPATKAEPPPEPFVPPVR